MTRVYDKKAIIRQIQTFLSSIPGNSCSIVPSGIYDEKTKSLIIDFQKKNGLEVTGMVDSITLEYLYKTYLNVLRDKNARDLSYPFIQFPIRQNTRSDGLIEIHRAMAYLLDYYGFMHNIRESSYYNEETKKAVKILRNLYMLKMNNIIDEELYFRIINDIKSIKIVK